MNSSIQTTIGHLIYYTASNLPMQIYLRLASVCSHHYWPTVVDPLAWAANGQPPHPSTFPPDISAPLISIYSAPTQSSTFEPLLIGIDLVSLSAAALHDPRSLLLSYMGWPRTQILRRPCPRPNPISAPRLQLAIGGLCTPCGDLIIYFGLFLSNTMCWIAHTSTVQTMLLCLLIFMDIFVV